MNKYCLFIYLASLFSQTVFGQNDTDSLRGKSFSYLNTQIDASEKDSTRVWIYLNAYIAKAKKEHNTGELLNGYQNAVHYAPDATTLAYADSLVYHALQTKKDNLIGTAYLTKGVAYYKKKDYQHTLDNYIIANDYLANTTDDYNKYKTKYNIALLKNYLGAHDEAIVLYKECIAYFNKAGYNNNRGYLTAINGLAFAYNRVGNYELCSQTTAFGIKEGKRLKQGLDVQYLIQTEGINQYSKKNYADAIQKISGAMPAIIKNEDFANEAVGYFYIGKSYLGLNEKDKALPYFFKVDSAYVKNKYTRADLRENYEILIGHYKALNDKDAQLLYINRLLKIDSIINTNYKYLTSKIIKQYDTKALIDAKKEIEAELHSTQQSQWVYIVLLGIAILGLIYLTFRYYRQQKIYRRKFEELMHKDTAPTTAEVPVAPVATAKSLDISPDVLDDILTRLQKFEQKQDFLKKELTQVKMSEMIKTNSSYLSKVINSAKGKSFTAYINDMRIEYVVDMLKNKPVYRMYTIKALADLSGFSTPQNFSDAFYNNTGIRPSYFISQLSKEYLKAV